jgi:hypothetical protein
VKIKVMPAHRPVRLAERRAEEAPDGRRESPHRSARGIVLGAMLGGALWTAIFLLLRRLFG